MEPRPVAAVITEWRTNSHADVLLSRLLEPGVWGHSRPFGLKLVSVYADHFPEADLCRPLCARHGIPVFPTIRGAVGVGTRGVPVDGVLIVGEHGPYATNARGQKLYPRRRFFDEVVEAFRILGRRVPVFSDKHLSYDWRFSRWMVDLARHERVPLMAGSSLPVAWRVPEWTLPIGTELAEAMALGYSDLDAYGFHALETLQCMVERRRGGESGVAAVRCVSGASAWEELAEGTSTRRLLDAIEPARRRALGRANDRRALPSDVLFSIEYRDGLKGAVAMLDSVGECFAFSCRRKGSEGPEAVVFALENARPFGHFGHLLRAIERMIATGRPSYPVERTLLTGGMLAALLESHAEGGRRIETPHLAEVGYEPVDWPFAPGAPGSPA